MVKSGTVLYGIQPEMALCHTEINSVFERLGYDCIITSIVGKQHKEYSLHPIGFAIDYRTKHITSRLALLVDTLKTALPCCDFLLEHVDGEQEHIHAEYDPKNDPKFIEAKAAYRATGIWVRK